MQLLQSTEQIGMLNSISAVGKKKCMCEPYSYLISFAFRRVFLHLERKSVRFQAMGLYRWAVLIWLLMKICLQKSALELVFESPEVTGLRTFCQIRTRHHWAFWKCPVPTECKAKLIHLRSLAGRPCSVLSLSTAVTDATRHATLDFFGDCFDFEARGPPLVHKTAEDSPQIFIAKIHQFHADTFSVWTFTQSLPWSQGIKAMEERKSNELTFKVLGSFHVVRHENCYSNTVQNDPWDKKQG